MIRFYLFVYAVIVFALWWCGPMVPDGWMQDTYCYARLVLHICGPVWIAKRASSDTAKSILESAEQSDQIYVTSAAAQHQ